MGKEEKSLLCISLCLISRGRRKRGGKWRGRMALVTLQFFFLLHTQGTQNRKRNKRKREEKKMTPGYSAHD